jgi:hypothetical protein
MKERQINTMMSSRASSLLRKASAGFEPSSADKTKTRAAIARRVAVGLAAGVAVAAGAKSAAAAPSIAPAAAAAVAPSAVAPVAAGFAGVSFATKLVAAVALVGTVSAGAVTVNHVTHEANRASHVATIPAAQVAAAPVAAAIPVAADMQQSAPLEIPVQQSAAPQPATLPAQVAPPVSAPIANPAQNKPVQTIAASPKITTTAPALQTGAEAELLQRAQEALKVDPNRALALLNEHAQRFPNGTLAEERDAARVLALCGAGRQEDAAIAGAAFLSAHPDSPLASRVRSSCANGVNASE